MSFSLFKMELTKSNDTLFVKIHHTVWDILTTKETHKNKPQEQYPP